MGRPENVEGCGSCRDTGYCRFALGAGVIRETFVVPDVADLAERKLVVNAQIAQIQREIASLAEYAKTAKCPNIDEVVNTPITE